MNIRLFLGGLRPPKPSRGWGNGETRFPHTPLREPMFTLAVHAAAPHTNGNAHVPGRGGARPPPADRRGCGETRFPPCLGGRRPPASACRTRMRGNQVSPPPCLGGRRPSAPACQTRMRGNQVSPPPCLGGRRPSAPACRTRMRGNRVSPPPAWAGGVRLPPPAERSIAYPVAGGRTITTSSAASPASRRWTSTRSARAVGTFLPT